MAEYMLLTPQISVILDGSSIPVFALRGIDIMSMNERIDACVSIIPQKDCAASPITATS